MRARGDGTELGEEGRTGKERSSLAAWAVGEEARSTSLRWWTREAVRSIELTCLFAWLLARCACLEGLIL